MNTSRPKSPALAGKADLHPRNRHRGAYDFARLTAIAPDLARFVTRNRYGNESIDFADPVAVKALNRALLKTFYAIDFWEIPSGFLCPPIPGRADYIHYLADLIGTKKDASVRVLDIGTGANLIYPLLGQRAYSWQFVGADIDAAALANAQTIIENNAGLASAIELRLQPRAQHIFHHVIGADEQFAATLCNPPFHASAAEAATGTQRKLKNLSKNRHEKTGAIAHGSDAKPALNFGGRHNELWCAGGEAAFIERMIRESVDFAGQVRWFTTLVSKSENLPALKRALRQLNCPHVRTIAMHQGQKTSRILAWSFQG